MSIKKSLFSISIKKQQNFTQEEIDDLQHDLTGFLSMFLDKFLMPPITPNDNVLEISFEENARAKCLIENHLFNTKAYDQSFDVVFEAEEISWSEMQIA